jgi:hypothetical protein
VDELLLLHPEHLLTERPDLVCYLGLPPGWVVQHSPSEWRASFEPEILADS